MPLTIRGLGTATPKNSVAQRLAAEFGKLFVYQNGENGDVDRLISRIYRMTQVQQRSSVLLEKTSENKMQPTFYHAARGADDHGPSTQMRMQRYALEASPLALAAARRSLRNAELPSNQITNLITVSCTGFQSPGVEFSLLQQLPLPPTVSRVNIGFMGCHGVFNGLNVARAFVEANAAARVLLASVELCSLHYHYGWDSEKVVANAIFADGASAMVGQAADRDDPDDWTLVDNGSYVMPDSADEMTWIIGDNGFEMTLSARVPDLIRQQLRPWLGDWLARHNLSIEQVGSWAIHPGGPRIVQGVMDALQISREAASASFDVLANYGNMSSATILFVIQQLRQQQAPLPCVAIGFGPGLVAEVALFV